jgi:dTDP-4-amino-4,6-dideoxygalactose transaminase
MAGSFGRAAAFSFYPTKNLGAMGDAGMLVTNDDAVADKAHQLRQYGWDRKYQVTTAGGRNSRMDEIQATVLAVQFPYLDSWNHRRRTIAARYGAGIRSPRLRLPEAVGAAGVAHLYVVVCDDRDGLRQHLSDHFIGCEIHYPIPDHRQPAWSGAAATLPVTEALAASVLTLPCFPELTDPEVDRVIACVNSW